MYRIIFYFKIMVFLIFLFPRLTLAAEELLNEKITELLKPNWPYHAFLAIPRIAEMQPILAIEISEKDKIIEDLYCVQIRYFDFQKQFEPKALLSRESLHKLLCKAMKRSVKKTPEDLIIQNFPGVFDIALSFDFSNGLVRVIEMPYPPMDPLSQLENVFLDEGDILSFGELDLPKELELEINQTPL